MRTLLLIIVFLLSFLLFAAGPATAPVGDPPSLKDPDSVAIAKSYTAAATRAKAEYDRAMLAAQKSATIRLKARMAVLTKAGDLDAALAVRAFMDWLSPPTVTASGPGNETDTPAKLFMPVNKLLGTWSEGGGAKLLFSRDGRFTYVGQPGTWQLTETALILTWAPGQSNSGRVDTYTEFDPEHPDDAILGTSPWVSHGLRIFKIR